MSSVALRNDTLIEISTFLIRRWSENHKIIVTMSPKKVNETRIKENKVILTPILDYNGDLPLYQICFWYIMIITIQKIDIIVSLSPELKVGQSILN